MFSVFSYLFSSRIFICLRGGGGFPEYHDNGATINFKDPTVKSALLFFSLWKKTHAKTYYRYEIGLKNPA